MSYTLSINKLKIIDPSALGVVIDSTVLDCVTVFRKAIHTKVNENYNKLGNYSNVIYKANEVVESQNSKQKTPSFLLGILRARW